MTRVVIVSKTNYAEKKCVGAVSVNGQSYRLLPIDYNQFDEASRFHPPNTPFEIGDVWEIDFKKNPNCIPPHNEDVILKSKNKIKHLDNLDEIIPRIPNVQIWNDDNLFENKLKRRDTGTRCILEDNLPDCSTGFWKSNFSLNRTYENKKYYFVSKETGIRIKYIGEQNVPIQSIPSGNLIRVSLSTKFKGYFWLQLSGWYFNK